MGFKLVICPPDIQEDWPEKLQRAIPGIEVHLCSTVGEAMEVIEDADAAHGDIVSELFARAKNLKWIQCGGTGVDAVLKTPEVAESDVVLTNMIGPHTAPIADHTLRTRAPR